MDPDGDVIEQVLWIDPVDLPGNPMVRDELAASLGEVLPLLGCGADDPAEGDEATCPCGTPVVYDEMNGWQHADGSVSHDDGESVSDKMAAVAKAYPDGQSFASHAFRPTAGYPNVCHYCGTGASDPWHDAYREVAKAGDGKVPKAPSWPGWKLGPAAGAYWSPKVMQAAQQALSRNQLNAIASAYITDHQGQDGTATGKRERNAAALAWLTSRGTPVPMQDAASGVTADSALIGGASAEAAASGQDDAEAPGWTPGDTATAARRAGELGLAALLIPGGGDSPDIAGNMEDGYLGAVSRVLAGWDEGTAADELSGMLGDAVGDEAYARTLTATQVELVIGLAALRWYTANRVALLQWYAGPGACQICLDNAAAAPRPPGVLWPGGVAEPLQHPACVIGSTRVTAPVGMVASQEAPGLPLGPALLCVGLGGDGSLPPAAAVTVAERDFGRGNIRAVSDREYVGQVITVRTALGHELTATPNHPVATRRGWVPIAELKVGDHVLSSTGSEWETASVHPDIDDIPPRIEDVAQTFPVLFGPVPTAAEDFHGDGAGSDVHVVRSDRLLGNDLAAGITEHVAEHDLSGRGVAAGRALPLDAERLPGKVLGALRRPPHSGMGSAGDPGALLRGRPRHEGVHPLATVPGLHAGLQKPAADYATVDAEGFCESLLALTPGVTEDEILHVKRDVVATHVYNLETVSGWYIGNGILTHNCGCFLAPPQS